MRLQCIQSCTLLYCTVLYCTVLYCTVLYCTLQYFTDLYCTLLYSTVLCWVTRLEYYQWYGELCEQLIVSNKKV